MAWHMDLNALAAGDEGTCDLETAGLGDELYVVGKIHKAEQVGDYGVHRPRCMVTYDDYSLLSRRQHKLHSLLKSIRA